VLVEARCERREGRKTWIRAEVRDGDGVVCAEGEGLFVDVPASRL